MAQSAIHSVSLTNWRVPHWWSLHVNLIASLCCSLSPSRESDLALVALFLSRTNECVPNIPWDTAARGAELIHHVYRQLHVRTNGTFTFFSLSPQPLHASTSALLSRSFSPRLAASLWANNQLLLGYKNWMCNDPESKVKSGGILYFSFCEQISWKPTMNVSY